MNFDGPVRAATTAPVGVATVTLSFAAWAGAKVAPTTHVVFVAAKKGPAPEPVAPNLVASLVHPDRTASVWTVRFSPDGKQLFTAGYPSGVVQFWDVAARQELRRVETPRGYRGSAEYALLTPDWTTLYVPVEKRTVKPIEKGGKSAHRIEYAGRVRVFDAATGAEREPLLPPPGSAGEFARLDPSGRFLLSVELSGYDSDADRPARTVLWDLATRTRRPIAADYLLPAFAPDGKTFVARVLDPKTRTSTAKLIETATGKELASLPPLGKDRNYSPVAVSPDGAVVAVQVGGKKGGPLETWFRDARTLEDRGTLTGDGHPDEYGWFSGVFTPDGKRYVAVDGPGRLLVWDVAKRAVVRSVPVLPDRVNLRLVLSPDGKTAAVGWMPKADPALLRGREPDPRDLPQPRVTLVDLAGDRPPRTLVAPHGWVGGLAFSPDGRTLAFGGAGAVHLFDLTR